jgi:hypothetical protein
MSKASHQVIAEWLAHFEPMAILAGAPFDKDMEAASLALAMEECGYLVMPKAVMEKAYDCLLNGHLMSEEERDDITMEVGGSIPAEMARRVFSLEGKP